MITRAQFVDEARRLVKMNVRFKRHGRNYSGVDCWGVVVVTCRSLGLAVADDATYGPHPPPELAKKLLEHTGIRKPVRQMRAGDLVLIKLDGADIHVGIIGQNAAALSLISCSLVTRKVSEHSLQGFPHPIVAAYSVRGVEP
jgi:hypothetical protein